MVLHSLLALFIIDHYHTHSAAAGALLLSDLTERYSFPVPCFPSTSKRVNVCRRPPPPPILMDIQTCFSLCKKWKLKRTERPKKPKRSLLPSHMWWNWRMANGKGGKEGEGSACMDAWFHSKLEQNHIINLLWKRGGKRDTCCIHWRRLCQLFLQLF